jgi:hypothetical protein
MSGIGFAAFVLVAAVFSGCAHAEALDARDLYRRAEALVQSLIGGHPADREIIKPSGNMDPQMALVPPPDGTMRMIAPPGKPRQQ